MSNDTSTNLFWIDALSVFSTFAVIVLHVSAKVVIGTKDTASLNWWIGNFIDSSVRWCVPVFVMISGALLLDPTKKESVSGFLKKRAARILLPLVFWTLIYILHLAKIKTFSLTYTLLKILIGYPYPHLWYLYMLLGLYLTVPFLRTYIRSSSYKERYQLIFFIFLFASITAMIKFFLFNNTPTIFTLFIPYIGYLLCGYQLRLIGKTKASVKLICLIIAICLLVIALGTGLLVNIYGLTKGLFFYDYFAPPVILMSICVFLFVCKILFE